MAHFIEKTIFCRYGISHHIVTDNGVQFQGEVVELLEKYRVEHHKSSPYRPQANGWRKQQIKRSRELMTSDDFSDFNLNRKLKIFVFGKTSDKIIFLVGCRN